MKLFPKNRARQSLRAKTYTARSNIAASDCLRLLDEITAQVNRWQDGAAAVSRLDVGYEVSLEYLRAELVAILARSEPGFAQDEQAAGRAVLARIRQG